MRFSFALPRLFLDDILVSKTTPQVPYSIRRQER
jgi:hypothetical protein